MKKSTRIIIPQNMNPRPSDEEMWVAWILLKHFQKDIIFIERCNTKTPALLIDNLKWEIKSPVGNSAKTIENILRDATKQSRNIILSLKRTKLPYQKAIANTNKFLHHSSKLVNNILLITKSGKIIDIKNRK